MSRLWGVIWIGVVLCSCTGASARAAEGPVNAAIERDVARARGTVVLVHAGGWSGPDLRRELAMDAWPGSVFRSAHWNTISIDYSAGKSGLASVASQIAAARATAHRGRVCVYGESAGGHLALLAAAELPGLRCVITLGAPTDFEAWREDAAFELNTTSMGAYAQTAAIAFGAGPSESSWQPVAVADGITARVLLIGQGDDQVLPIMGQLRSFATASPKTDVLVTAPGDYSDPEQHYLHGTLSASARTDFEARLRAFVTPARRR